MISAMIMSCPLLVEAQYVTALTAAEETLYGSCRLYKTAHMPGNLGMPYHKQAAPVRPQEIHGCSISPLS